MIARSITVACCLFAAAAVLYAAGQTERVAPLRPLQQLPWHLDGWQGQAAAPIDPTVLSTLGVDDFVNRVYSRPGVLPVALYVGFYGSQAEGDRIHSPLNCLPGAGWEPVHRSVATIPVPDARRGARSHIEVNRMVIAKGLDRQLVLYWFQGRGRVTANEYWGRALLLVDAFRLSRTDGALVRVIAPIASGAPEAQAPSDAAAVRFVQAVFPALQAFLP